MQSPWYFPVGILNYQHPHADICERNLKTQLQYIYQMHYNYHCFDRQILLEGCLTKQLKNCHLPGSYNINEFRNVKLENGNPFEELFLKEKEFLTTFNNCCNNYFSKQLNIHTYPYLKKLIVLKKSEKEMSDYLTFIECDIKSKKNSNNKGKVEKNVFDDLRKQLMELWNKVSKEEKEIIEKGEKEERELKKIKESVKSLNIEESEEKTIKMCTESIRENDGILILRRKKGSSNKSLLGINNYKEKIQKLEVNYNNSYDCIVFTDFTFRGLRSKDIFDITNKTRQHNESIAFIGIEKLNFKYLYKHVKKALPITKKISIFVKDKKYLGSFFKLLIIEEKSNLSKFYLLDGFLSDYENIYKTFNLQLIHTDDKLNLNRGVDYCFNLKEQKNE